MTTPYYADEYVTLFHGDCLEILRTLPDSSVDAVITDPPYFRAINEPWDKAWNSPDGFTAWLRGIAEEWARVLVPNGTLYVFASPQMAARVELHAVEPAGFAVLNRIVWHKTDAKIHRANRDGLTQYHSGDNERLLMAVPLKEHQGAKDARNAYGNALWALTARVFAPIREYLAAERDRSGFTDRQIDEALGYNGMAGHWFGSSQWTMPNAQHYARLRDLLNRRGDYEYLRRGDYEYLRRDYEYLRRDYEYLRRDYEDLRRDYEYLRRDYEDLRRPFDLGPESGLRPRGEVWRFAPLPARGRGSEPHPCEKPQPLLDHIVRTSTKPGAVILDSFTGSGAVGVAAVNAGRRFIGSELSAKWAEQTAKNIRRAQAHQHDTLDFGDLA